MASIKIETGLKVYDIEDENGNVRGQISFNPADVNLFPRAQKMVDKISKTLEELSSLDEDSMTDKDISIKIEEYDSIIKKEINTLFDDDNASFVVFGNQNAFNTLNGVTFVERFITAFLPIIEKETKNERRKSVEKIEKYTSQVTE